MFTLTPINDETSCFVDDRIGLMICIPGRPQLATVAPRSDEPTYEALIKLGDIPVSVRYRQAEFPAPANPAATMLGLIETYAANRCREPVTRAAVALEPQRRAWNVEAAASLMYPLRAPADDDDIEEVLILYKSGRTVTVTKRFASSRTSWVSWLLCNSGFAAGIRWDPKAKRGPVWPRSTFMLRGVKGLLWTKRLALAQQLSALVTGDIARLSDRLARLLQGSEAPAHVITSAERAAFEGYIAEACDQPELREVLLGIFVEVKTAHDLRGFVLLCLHAFGKLVATFGSEGEDALSYLVE